MTLTELGYADRSFENLKGLLETAGLRGIGAMDDEASIIIFRRTASNLLAMLSQGYGHVSKVIPADFTLTTPRRHPMIPVDRRTS